MAEHRVPKEWEKQVLIENGLQPEEVTIEHSDPDTIRALCFLTRDHITINKGDRPWPAPQE